MIRKALTAPFRASWRGLKAAMRWTGQARYAWQFLLPRTKFDFQREVGDGTSNSIVSAVLLWMARTFPEAPVTVFEATEAGEERMVIGHGLGRKIERPNPYYAGPLMWHATIIDWAASGNAYWIKVRNRVGEVVELWWAPSWTMEPKWPDDGSEFISHYEYKPDSVAEGDKLSVSDVVHFRHGIDPNNSRKGLGPLRAVLKEVFTDEEAATFTAALIRNLGIPGVIISPEGMAKVDKEAAEEVLNTFNARFRGDERGETMVMKAPTKVQVLSFSPEQMQLKELRRVPEERITAVFGVSAVVVGLGAGLDRSTMTNFPAMREAAYESNTIPSQRMIAADLTVQLLPDFEKGPALEQRRVGFDLRNVRVLQPDQDKLYERVDCAVRGGWAKVSEAKRVVGLPVLPGDDVYLRQFTVVPVGEGSTPALPPKGMKGLPSMEGLSESQARFIRSMAAARTRVADAYGPQVREFFEAQAKRALGRLNDVVEVRSGNGARQKQGIVGPKTLLPDDEDDLLIATLRPLWLAGVSGAWGLAAEAYGFEVGFDEESAVVANVLSEAAYRARRINDGTRAALGESLDEGQRRGYTIRQIVDGVPDDEFVGMSGLIESYYEGRPETVAITEAMWSTNMGSTAAYRSNGVERVEMHDGTEHEPCASRNGAIVTVGQAEAANNHEHAHGTLTLAPILS